MDAVTRLTNLTQQLKSCASIEEKLQALNEDEKVKKSTALWKCSLPFLEDLSFNNQIILKSLMAIEQEKVLLDRSLSLKQAESFLEELIPVDRFYQEMGGIVGYHHMMLSLMRNQRPKKEEEIERFLRPEGIDLSEEGPKVRDYVREGILSLPFLAEIYPVGGAADRLRFCDSSTGMALPAAKLPFGQLTLIERLVRDTAAREYLYYKLFQKQLTTPIAMMTSYEKDNHRQLMQLFEEKKWFGRPKEAFYFFCQPLVPTMDREGNWCTRFPFQLMMKPGGHGVLWKLAKEEGVFDWLKSQGKTKILLRQINNPIAGIDYGLLGFFGVGCKEQKRFGFSSCLRQVQSAEGVNVLIERKKKDGFEYRLTNVEYCDFEAFGINDVPLEPLSSYSQYPSNTNILFADLSTIEKTVSCCPIPGMLVNFKKMQWINHEGKSEEKWIARLESMMQNIADALIYPSSCSLKDHASLPVFLTYQRREKTISTAKREFQKGGALLETPEGCYYDLLQNARELLTQVCHFQLPQEQRTEEYLTNGPAFIFSYHPALGPLYSIIAQKVQKGILNEGSWLNLEIAEIEIQNLQLSGSLHVIATHPIQGVNKQYSNQVGRCQLIDVVIENLGMDRHETNNYWKGEIKEREKCEIVIHEDGEFYAEKIILKGDVKIEVPPKTKVTAFLSEKGELQLKQEAITPFTPSWEFVYRFLEDKQIQVKKEILHPS